MKTVSSPVHYGREEKKQPKVFTFNYNEIPKPLLRMTKITEEYGTEAMSIPSSGNFPGGSSQRPSHKRNGSGASGMSSQQPKEWF